MITVEFTRPVFLWLVILIPILVGAHFYFLKHTQSKALRFANFETLKRIAGKRFVVKNSFILILRSLIFIFLISSLAGVTVWYDGNQNDFDYVLAIDTSPSMLTKDIFPSRLGAAKNAGILFLDSLSSETQVAMVTFSGVTYVRNGLDSNKLSTRLNLDILNLSRTSGTDIAGAIITSTNLFSDDDSRGRSIIIFSDGVDTAGTYMDESIHQAVAYAVHKKVVIHIVGLGTNSAPIGYLPEIYNLSSSIDKELISYVTNATSGLALYPTTSQDVIDDFKSLNTEFHEAKIPFHLEVYGIMFAIFLLLLEWVFINMRFRRVA